MKQQPATSEPALSGRLSALTQLSAERPVTLGEINTALGDNATHLLSFVLALPFIIPLPSAGLSTVLGIVIAASSLHIVRGREPRLSAKFSAKTLPAGFLSKLLRASRRIVLILEKFLRRRHTRIADAPRIHALLVFYSALVLMLPLPIPLSNTFPAWSILLATSGLMQRDGLAILAAHIVALAGIAYFAILALTGANLWEMIKNALGL